MKKLCGIDEAGRGPLAGPMVLAGVILNSPIDGLNDSKKLTQNKREKLFKIIIQNSLYHIVFISNEYIDKYGLSKSIQYGLNEIMQHLDTDEYLFDGNTTFGIKNLKSQIKADQSVAEVSAASILAKVSRDDYMVKIASKFPNYNFEKHKGYGTKTHIEAIKKYGLSTLHRKSYKLKALESST